MRTSVVTGATSGVGKATAIELARRGDHVVLAARSSTRAAQVMREIDQAGGTSTFLHLDLASFGSIRSAAAELVAGYRTIDVAINNAGVGRARGLTEDGFEQHFGINHLGHFLFNALTRELLSEDARIVSVTSSVHRRVDGIDFDRLRTPAKSFWGLDEYGASKLANILYTAELARRHPGWRTYAVHPGLTDTKILPWVVRLAWRRRLRSPEEGAATIIECATADRLSGESGNYYADGKREEPSIAAHDDDLARQLWDRSVEWCGATPVAGDHM